MTDLNNLLERLSGSERYLFAAECAERALTTLDQSYERPDVPMETVKSIRWYVKSGMTEKAEKSMRIQADQHTRYYPGFPPESWDELALVSDAGMVAYEAAVGDFLGCLRLARKVMGHHAYYTLTPRFLRDGWGYDWLMPCAVKNWLQTAIKEAIKKGAVLSEYKWQKARMIEYIESRR